MLFRSVFCFVFFVSSWFPFCLLLVCLDLGSPFAFSFSVVEKSSGIFATNEHECSRIRQKTQDREPGFIRVHSCLFVADFFFLLLQA